MRLFICLSPPPPHEHCASLVSGPARGAGSPIQQAGTCQRSSNPLRRGGGEGDASAALSGRLSLKWTQTKNSLDSNFPWRPAASAPSADSRSNTKLSLVFSLWLPTSPLHITIQSITNISPLYLCQQPRLTPPCTIQDYNKIKYIVHDGHLTLSYIPPCKYINIYLYILKN